MDTLLSRALPLQRGALLINITFDTFNFNSPPNHNCDIYGNIRSPQH